LAPQAVQKRKTCFVILRNEGSFSISYTFPFSNGKDASILRHDKDNWNHKPFFFARKAPFFIPAGDLSQLATPSCFIMGKDASYRRHDKAS
jgi:hypothetical protein